MLRLSTMLSLTLLLATAVSPCSARGGPLSDAVESAKSKAKGPKGGTDASPSASSAPVDAAPSADLRTTCMIALRDMNALLSSLPTDTDQVWGSRLGTVLSLQEHDGVTGYFQVEEAIAENPRAKGNCPQYDALQESMASLQGFAPTFAAGITPLLDEAHRVHGFPDVPGAIDYATRARDLAAVAVWLDEEDADAQSGLRAADEALSRYKSEYASTLSGTFHADHVGGLYLSRRPIVLGAEREGELTADWTLGEPTYLAAYYPGRLDQMAGNPGGGARMEVRLYSGNQIAGQAAVKYAWTQEASVSSRDTAIALELWPTDPASVAQAGLATKIGTYLGGLRPGEHTFILQVSATDARDGGRSTGKYEGPAQEIHLVVPADLTDFSADLASIRGQWVASQRMPKSSKVDATLQAQMMKAYTEAGWSERTLRAVVLQSDWTLFRDAWNTVVSRTILGAVAVDPGTGECVVYQGIFQQDALPGGKWTAPTLNLITGDTPIACGNVSK